MQFDYGSVLMAVGVAGAALCITLVLSWLRQRDIGFLLSWAIAMAIIVVSVTAFSAYSAGGADGYGLAAAVGLTTGFAVAQGAAHQFASGRFPARRVGGVSVALALPMMASLWAGYDGLMLVLLNLFVAVQLVLTARIYWQARSESVTSISVIAALYGALGVSFFVCAIVLITESPLHLQGPPSNWAEVLNLVVSLIGVTGIGALSIALHQERIARAHQLASITDSLTALLNRRALFDLCDTGPVAAGTAVVVFDLDEFKSINDRFGHDAGDRVLQAFARVLGAAAPDDGIAARMGGEEFALVLPRSSPEMATLTAERVRVAFAQTPVETEAGPLTCTVSAGVAIAVDPHTSFDGLLRGADQGLYMAKRNGRNKVASTGIRLVA